MMSRITNKHDIFVTLSRQPSVKTTGNRHHIDVCSSSTRGYNDYLYWNKVTSKQDLNILKVFNYTQRNDLVPFTMNTVGFETLWMLSKALCLFHLQIIQNFAQISIFLILYLPRYVFSFQNSKLFFLAARRNVISESRYLLRKPFKDCQKLNLSCCSSYLPYITWRVSFVPCTKAEDLQNKKYKEPFKCSISIFDFVSSCKY